MQLTCDHVDNGLLLNKHQYEIAWKNLLFYLIQGVVDNNNLSWDKSQFRHGFKSPAC